MASNDGHNTHGTPGEDEEADTASGGAPDDDSGSAAGTDTTDERGLPLDNPSGG